MMLAMVSALREGDFYRHLQAERRTINLIFAFDHVNYARYNSYQHVYLTELAKTNPRALENLCVQGFGASPTGELFSSVHEDLVTEHFNRETKGTAGPFRSGYISNSDTVNKWITTSHIHSKLINVLREHLHMYTSSQHKELTPGNKKLHSDHVRSLKTKLLEYNVDPFASEPATCLPTGEEIDPDITRGLVDAERIGHEKYRDFVEGRLVVGSKFSIFDRIKLTKIEDRKRKK